MSAHSDHKALLQPFQSALYHGDGAAARKALVEMASQDCVFRMCHPIGEVQGAADFFDSSWAELMQALPDLERRTYIQMAGDTDRGLDWVGCGGFYNATFVAPWLDIPPTGHIVHMRFHEFYRFEGGKLAEFQAIWDIPELMMQAQAWPMAPSLGREWCIPGPANNDGVMVGSRNAEQSQQSCDLIVDMLDHMTRHPADGGPEVMEMPKFWHPRMNWYGPAGIGSGRGIAGFRHWHQIPFLAGMPDRGASVDQIVFHFFGEQNYVAVTGWPNMVQTVSHDGWMGIAPAGKKISLCSLDFWRIENGLIRENWVLVDILDAYRQLGVDVLGRMAEFNKVRSLAPVPLPADPAVY